MHLSATAIGLRSVPPVHSNSANSLTTAASASQQSHSRPHSGNQTPTLPSVSPHLTSISHSSRQWKSSPSSDSDLRLLSSPQQQQFESKDLLINNSINNNLLADAMQLPQLSVTLHQQNRNNKLMKLHAIVPRSARQSSDAPPQQQQQQQQQITSIILSPHDNDAQSVTIAALRTQVHQLQLRNSQLEHVNAEHTRALALKEQLESELLILQRHATKFLDSHSTNGGANGTAGGTGSLQGTEAELLALRHECARLDTALGKQQQLSKQQQSSQNQLQLRFDEQSASLRDALAQNTQHENNTRLLQEQMTRAQSVQATVEHELLMTRHALAQQQAQSTVEASHRSQLQLQYETLSREHRALTREQVERTVLLDETSTVLQQHKQDLIQSNTENLKLFDQLKQCRLELQHSQTVVGSLSGRLSQTSDQSVLTVARHSEQMQQLKLQNTELQQRAVTQTAALAQAKQQRQSLVQQTQQALDRDSESEHKLACAHALNQGLQARLESVDAEHTRLSTELQRVSAEQHQLAVERNGVQAQLRTQADELTGLKQQLKSQVKQCAQLDSQLTGLTRERDSLLLDAKSLQEARADAEKASQHTQTRLETTTLELTELRTKTTDAAQESNAAMLALQHRLASSDQALITLQTKMTDTNLANYTLTEQCNALRTQLTALQQSQHEANEQIQQERSDLMRRQTMLESALRLQHSERDEMQRVTSARDAQAREQMSALQSQLAVSEQTCQDQVLQMQEEAKRITVLEQKITALETELHAWQSKYTTLATQHAQCESQQSTAVQQCQATIAQQRSDVAVLRADKQQLAEQCRSLRLENETQRERQRSVQDETLAMRQSLQTQLTELTHMRDAEVQQCSALRTQQASQFIQLTQLRSALTERDERCVALQSQLKQRTEQFEQAIQNRVVSIQNSASTSGLNASGNSGAASASASALPRSDAAVTNASAVGATASASPQSMRQSITRRASLTLPSPDQSNTASPQTGSRRSSVEPQSHQQQQQQQQQHGTSTHSSPTQTQSVTPATHERTLSKPRSARRRASFNNNSNNSSESTKSTTRRVSIGSSSQQVQQQQQQQQQQSTKQVLDSSASCAPSGAVTPQLMEAQEPIINASAASNDASSSGGLKRASPLMHSGERRFSAPTIVAQLSTETADDEAETPIDEGVQRGNIMTVVVNAASPRHTQRGPMFPKSGSSSTSGGVALREHAAQAAIDSTPTSHDANSVSVADALASVAQRETNSSVTANSDSDQAKAAAAQALQQLIKLPLALGLVFTPLRHIFTQPLPDATVAQQGGCLVTEIKSNQAAARAGLQCNDVLLSVNSFKVQNKADVFASLRGVRAGDRVRVVVLRTAHTPNSNQASAATASVSASVQLQLTILVGAKGLNDTELKALRERASLATT